MKRTTIKTVLAVNGIAVALAVLFGFGEKPFAASAFEYGKTRVLTGEIQEFPHPSLLVPRPGHANGVNEFSRYLLVAQGKHGASGIVRGLDGRTVRIQGSLIYRAGDTMIEMTPGTESASPGALVPEAGTPNDLGAVTLSGEIVDSKCYLGVMNPGEGKVHRDCAVRCISGGIPPMLRVRDGQGSTKLLLLVGMDGRQLNREVLDFVAEPITVRGRLFRSGELLILKAEPKSFLRGSQ